MTNLKYIKENIRILGWYQLIGGFLGIGLALFMSMAGFSEDSSIQGILVLLGLIILPFLLSIYAGYLCIYDKPKKILVSKINQILQVLSFSIAGYAYTYYAGVFFSIGIDTTLESLININFRLSAINIEFNTQTENYIVYFNVIAFYLLLKIMKYEDLDEDEEEIVSNGNSYLDEDFISND